MAKIPLRAYNRDIENLINRGQIDEAIGHCKHILRFFPKHIDTYRLLGKAYLEGQHYAEAYDVLQRVLSTVPDDFISQIGMSIIREDEGNLDAAIWHMERAFEVQPANTAVQGELRRLYGRRDGIEPPKIRLTRGALIRMYARGELYQQAIGEIRTALAEDPKRLDFEITLARMYYLSGMKVEATEICSRVISKLPFCFEANRILAEILPETARADDAKIYQQRVDSMDPYAAYIAPNTPTLADIPDNVVTLERLEWNPDAAASQKPEWARTVGIEWEDQQDVLPEWMDNSQDALTAEEKPIVDDVILPEFTPSKDVQPEALSPEESSPSGEQIPDWMQAAGWGKSTGEEAPPTENALFEEEQAESELAGGEIPDWLQSIAPQAVEGTSPSEDVDRLNLLSSILPESGPIGEPSSPIAETGQEFSTGPDVPDWMKQEESPAESAIFESSSQETPDWLKELTGAPEGTAPSSEEIPAWLQPEGESGQPSIAGQGIDLPDLIPTTTDAISQIPDTKIEEPADQQPAATTPENPDEAFAWLEALATRQGAADETLLTKPEDRAETPPDWVKQIEETVPPMPASIPTSEETTLPESIAAREESAEGELPDWLKTLQSNESVSEPVEAIEPPVSFSEIPAVADGPVDSEIPDWLKQLQPESDEPVSEAVEEIEAIDNIVEQQPAIAEEAQEGEVPDWLKALQTEETEPISETVEQIEAIDTAPEIPIATTEDSPGGEVPDWLKDLQPQAEDVISEPVDASAGLQEGAIEGDAPDWLKELQAAGSESIAESESEPEELERALPLAASSEVTQGDANAMDPDSAFSWLESLAARQGADEETLLVKPEDRKETPPDWVQQQIESEQEGAQMPVAESPVTSEESASASELEDAAPTEEIPDWMKSLEGETKEATAAKEEVPEWLQESSAVTPSDETTAEIPEWLQAIEPKGEEPPETAPVRPEATTGGDDAFAWLESLAAKQGADEETLLLKPEDRLEKPPEWVAEQAAETIQPSEVEKPLDQTEVPQGIAETPSSEVPEWLKELESEPAASEIEAETFESLPEANLPALESSQEASSIHAEELPVEIPDWLTELEKEPVADEEEIEALSAVEQAEPQPEVADSWQQEIPETASVEEGLLEPVMKVQDEGTQPVTIAATAAQTSAVVQPVAIDVQPVLNRARTALTRGKVQEALVDYVDLIKHKSALDETIQDLQNALYQHPVDIDLWQAIGDAYAHSNRLQDALDSYTKAEELLR